MKSLKLGVHIVVTGRWVLLTVLHGHWSIWVAGNHCQSLAVSEGRWLSLRVVGCRQRYFVFFPYGTNEMTGSLGVFQGLSRSLKPGFQIVVSGLSRSLLKLKFLQNCERREQPWKTANEPVVSFVSYGNKTKYLYRLPTTLKDCQPLALNTFGANSSNVWGLWDTVGELSTTLKDSQRLAVIGKDPDTSMTAKDNTWRPVTK